MFAPRPNAPTVAVRFDPIPITRLRARLDVPRFEDQVALSGIGSSPIARRLPASSLQLTVAACRAAVHEAGLTLADIDGLSAYPGSSGLPGISEGGVRALEAALGVQPTWHCGAHEVPGQTGNIVMAMLAVAAGLCRHVWCVTSVSQSARPGAGQRARGDACARRIGVAAAVWRRLAGPLDRALCLPLSRALRCLARDLGLDRDRRASPCRAQSAGDLSRTAHPG